MKKVFLGLCLILPLGVFSQSKSTNYADLLAKIKEVKSHQFNSVGAIGHSYSGESIPVIKLQSNNNPKPTLLLVAGIDGKHPAGVVNSLEVVNQILALESDSLNKLLQDKSIWVIPMVNPDAFKRNGQLNVWNSGNSRVIDNDRDGRVNEDPSKDLNGDGIISQMRIESIGGTHQVHPMFSNVLVEADASKGERGKYLLFPESIDNDFDGKYGEDGEEGVNIDRNFTFDYPAFYPESGAYAASEPETRALMDFIFANPQISTILHFGLMNNLSDPEKYNSSKANTRIVESWSMNDVNVSKYVSSIYKDVTKSLGEASKQEYKPGNFTNTGYYHLGKFSFATPTWWPALADSVKGIKPEDVFYKWAITNNVEGAILPWSKIDHPNFPNSEVEVGGIVDIYRNNPPVSYLKESSIAHTLFVTRLLASLPKLEFQKPVVTALGGDVFRVELAVTNVGLMPTYPEIADRIKYASKFKTVCNLQGNQEFLNGKRLQLYPSLGAGKSQTFSWLIKGKGMVNIVAGCPTSGEINLEVKL